VAFGYTTRQGQEAERLVHPHAIVAHAERLYLTGFDVTRQARRTFRLDRITDIRLLEGEFTVSAEDDPVQQVMGPLTSGPGRYDVSFRIHADLAWVRTRIPETLASVTPAGADGGGWLRVFLRAERLEWVAGTLVMLDRPFVIEHPEELRNLVPDLAGRLIASASTPNDEAPVEAQDH
jgi:predicted DNA-binding transcriptional regulator YafY